MSRHRGRVSKRTDGRKGWRLEIDTTDPKKTGKRKRIVRSGFPTKGAAQDALAQLVNDQKRGVNLRSTPKLGEWLASEWLPAAAATVRPTTARLYSTMIRAYVIPHIGGLKLDEVTASSLTALYGELSERLAPKTIRNVHGLLHRALRDAVRWKLIAANPADAADPPRVPRKEPAVWTASQLSKFLEHTADDRLGALWRLAATTGMRRGSCFVFDGQMSTQSAAISGSFSSTLSTPASNSPRNRRRHRPGGGFRSTRRLSRCCGSIASGNSRSALPGVRATRTQTWCSVVRTVRRSDRHG